MKVPALLRQRWLFSLLGVVALGLLAWFLGPLWEPLASVVLRLAVIAMLAGIWLAWWGWRWWQIRRHSRELAAGMVAQDDTQRAVAEEEAILAERFQEAVSVLQRSPLKGRRLYQLPWYVLIGPPGVGKTTLLVNSNLRFPLADRFGREALRGVGGTRNCDWWFAEDAVLLDTAGRYTTQESRQAVDHAAWLAFLDLLKRHRPRRPLNGVIVVVNLAELLTQDETERHAHAKAIRQRIQELYQRLGVRLPVYCVLNKSDLLAGFDEYFDDLTPEERDQVWGMTLPLDEGKDDEAGIRGFEDEFKQLETRLHGRINGKLAREASLDRRERIYLFPHQFGAVRSVLRGFLEEIFRPSRFEEPVLLRGVYFTSATQEGSPIDRIMSSLAQTFQLPREQLPRFSGKGRAFFINDLLRRVIFPEAGLAGSDRRQEKRLHRLRLAALGLVGVTALGIAGLWGISAYRNRSYSHEVSEEAKRLHQEMTTLGGEAELAAWLPVLDRARRLVDMTKATSWQRDFGLSQENKLAEGAKHVYQRLLRHTLLPRVMVAMEQGIHDAMGDPRLLYGALRAYLMLDTPEHYDADTVRGWLSEYWRETVFSYLTAERRRMLSMHLDALLAQRPAPLPRALDAALIQDARVALANRPVAEQVYDSLRSAFPEGKIADFIPSRVLGPDGMLVFQRLSGEPLSQGLSGLYTRAGYHDYVAAASARVLKILQDESWVMGERFAVSPERLQSLRQEVLSLYAKDYVHRWQALLADVTLQSPRNLDHAKEMLKILSGENSPLRRWLTAVARETRLQPDPNPDGDLPATPLPRPIAGITERFEALHRQVTPVAEGSAPPIDALLGQLNEVYVQLDAFDEALKSGNAELIAQQQRRIDGTMKNLELALGRQPVTTAQPLGKVIHGVKLMTAGGRRQYLNAMWKSEVLPFCRRAIAGRYPIVAGGTSDITLADFARFFGPNGLMATFFDQYLAQSVDRSRSPWRWNPHEGAVVSRRALRQFEIAEEIRNMFFGASAQPLLRFSLEPISMSMDAVKGEVDIDGQRLVYEHGPIRPQWFRWPGRDAGNVVRLHFLPPVAGRPSGLQKSGPWAWLRLLDASEVTRTALPEQFLVTFQVGGRYLKLKMRASSAFNPFGSRVMRGFQCLSHL